MRPKPKDHLSGSHPSAFACIEALEDPFARRRSPHLPLGRRSRPSPPFWSSSASVCPTPGFTCRARLNDRSRSDRTSAPCLVQALVGQLGDFGRHSELEALVVCSPAAWRDLHRATRARACSAAHFLGTAYPLFALSRASFAAVAGPKTRWCSFRSDAAIVSSLREALYLSMQHRLYLRPLPHGHG